MTNRQLGALSFRGQVNCCHDPGYSWEGPITSSAQSSSTFAQGLTPRNKWHSGPPRALVLVRFHLAAPGLRGLKIGSTQRPEQGHNPALTQDACRSLCSRRSCLSRIKRPESRFQATLTRPAPAPPAWSFPDAGGGSSAVPWAGRDSRQPGTKAVSELPGASLA